MKCLRGPLPREARTVTRAVGLVSGVGVAIAGSLLLARGYGRHGGGDARDDPTASWTPQPIRSWDPSLRAPGGGTEATHARRVDSTRTAIDARGVGPATTLDRSSGRHDHGHRQNKNRLTLGRSWCNGSLPRACRRASNQRSSDSNRPAVERFPAGVPGGGGQFFEVKTLADFDANGLSSYVELCSQPLVGSGSDTAKANLTANGYTPYPERQPRAVYLVCTPDGVAIDTAVGGPVRARRESSAGPGIYMYQGKRWVAPIRQFRKFLATPGLQLVHVPGMAVQLAGWMGFTFQHFMLDTLIRLGFVYELLVSNDPAWGTAKIVASLGNAG